MSARLWKGVARLLCVSLVTRDNRVGGRAISLFIKAVRGLGTMSGANYGQAQGFAQRDYGTAQQSARVSGRAVVRQQVSCY
jgi:hypothetical protein